MTYEIRKMNEGDRAAVLRIIDDAFGEYGGDVRTLAEGLRDEGVVIDDLCFMAGPADHPVGCVMTSHMWLEADGARTPVLNLSPLAVEEPAQGQGAGRALVEAVVEGATSRPEPILFVEGWKDPTSVYDRYFQTLPEGITHPPEAFMVEACQFRPLASFDPEVHLGDLVYPETIKALPHD